MRNGRAAALPIPRPIFCSSPACSRWCARPMKNSSPAFFAALLFALAIFMKPIVAPAAAVMLGGAGLAALYVRQWPRLAGLCIGFLPVFSMALHNWVFGHVFVLFSANAGDAQAADHAAIRLCRRRARIGRPAFGGAHIAGAAMQIVHWLSGPAQILRHHSVECGRRRHPHLCRRRPPFRRFDPWLRLIARGRARPACAWRCSTMPPSPAIISSPGS